MDEIIVLNKETGELSIPEQVILAIKANEEMRRSAEETNKAFKKRLCEAMETYGVEKINTEYFTVSYVAEHDTTRIDSKYLKENHPEEYWDSLTSSTTKASVRVTLK